MVDGRQAQFMDVAQYEEITWNELKTSGCRHVVSCSYSSSRNVDGGGSENSTIDVSER